MIWPPGLEANLTPRFLRRAEPATREPGRIAPPPWQSAMRRLSDRLTRTLGRRHVRAFSVQHGLYKYAGLPVIVPWMPMMAGTLAT
jgi:hypothetical protein